MQNKTLHLEEKKKSNSSWKPQWESIGICFAFFFSDVQLKAHLSFSFGLFHLGLAAGNLRLMFGQFTIQVRNYITTPTPFPLESGRLRCPSNSCQCLALWSDVWRGTAPYEPPAPPTPFTLPHPSGTCTVTDEEIARRGGYVEGHCKVRLWYKSICNRCSLQVFL